MTFLRCVLALAISLAFADSGLRVFAQPTSKKIDHEPLPDGAMWRLGTTRMRHLGEVRQVAFTPNGQVASVGDDAQFVHWDVKTGMATKRVALFERISPSDLNAKQIEIMNLMDRRGTSSAKYYYASAEVTADGKSLVWSTPGKVRFLDVASGKEKAAFDFKGEKLGPATISRDGRLLARSVFGSERNADLSVFDVSSGKEIHKLRCALGELPDILCFSRNARYLAASASNQISLWDLATGKRIRRYEMPQLVTALSFTPRDGKLASASSQGVAFWDLKSDEETATLSVDDIPACAMAFSPDGSTLATSGGDNTILLWDIDKAAVKTKLSGMHAHVSALAFSSDSNCLISGCVNGDICTWDLTTQRQTTPVVHRPKTVPIAFAAPNEILVKSGTDEALQKINAATGDLVRGLMLPRQENRGLLAISASGRRSAQGELEGGVVQLWDNEKNVKSHKLDGHTTNVILMSFSPDGTLFATAEQTNLRVWNVQTGKQLHSLETSLAPADANRFIQISRYSSARYSTPHIAISHDNRLLVVLDLTGSLSLIEMTTGKERGHFRLGNAPINKLVLSRDGRLVAAISGDDVVRVWDTRNGKLVHGFVHPDGEITHLAFSSSSKLLAVGGTSGNVAVYDLVEDKLRRRFAGHRAPIQAILFAPDDTALLSSANDGLMYFWDLNAPSAITTTSEPTEAQLASLWEQLGDADPAKACAAMDKLLAHPMPTIVFVRNTLKPAPAVDLARLQHLIGELKNANYAVRDKASRNLAQMDTQIIPALEVILHDEAPVEAKRRITKIIEELEAHKTAPANFRAVRAVEVLERIGSQESTALLQSFSNGAAHSRLTTAAKDALSRAP
jgi:WD40 repeat protein